MRTAGDGPDAVYAEALRNEAVGVLGRMDREPLSGTRGCLDRTFWAWKFTDFPGARFQEGLCFLSYLYATPCDESPYHGSPQLREWISAGFDFWTSIQRRDGSFDEAYPFEQSLAATAFTGFYLSEAWNFMEGDLPGSTRDRFLRSLEAAGDWLGRNDEHHGFLSNHLAAAAGMLFHAHRITGASRFHERGRYFIDKILSHQSSEGWYDEYGGADPGYQSHGSFYLARCLELGADRELRESLERSFEFVAHFVHPDGSFGGEYASRNTQTYYPAAFEMLAGESGAASWIAQTLRPSVRDLSAAGLRSVDPYNLFPLLNNYVFAHRATTQRKQAPVVPAAPRESDEMIHFREAGLVVARRRNYQLVVGLGKGGVVKLFDQTRRRLVASDCGWMGRLRSGAVIATQWAGRERAASVQRDRIEVEGNFVQVSRPVMAPFRFIAFRLFTLTFGRVPFLATWIKALLVRVLIYRKRDVPLRFQRTIQLFEDGIEIRDRLAGNAPVSRLLRGAFFTTIHMGSSRYFVPNELAAPAPHEEEQLALGELASGFERTRRLRVE